LAKFEDEFGAPTTVLYREHGECGTEYQQLAGKSRYSHVKISCERPHLADADSNIRVLCFANIVPFAF
jgi:hypothetical protein